MGEKAYRFVDPRVPPHRLTRDPHPKRALRIGKASNLTTLHRQTLEVVTKVGDRGLQLPERPLDADLDCRIVI